MSYNGFAEFMPQVRQHPQPFRAATVRDLPIDELEQAWIDLGDGQTFAEYYAKAHSQEARDALLLMRRFAPYPPPDSDSLFVTLCK